MDKLTGDDIYLRFKNNKKSRKELINLIENESTVEQITTFAAMFPKTKLQEDFALVIALDKISQDEEGWMRFYEIMSRFKLMSDEFGILSQQALEEKLDKSIYVEKTILQGNICYRLKPICMEFDAVSVLWGALVDIVGGKENADKLYLIASERSKVDQYFPRNAISQLLH